MRTRETTPPRQSRLPEQIRCPRLRGDGTSAAAWKDLRKGHHVEVYLDDNLYGRGEIDDKAEDSTLIWVRFHDGRGRHMCFLEDGFSVVVQEPDASLVQQQTRALARGAKR